jgi:flagellar hook-associated protein 2
MRIERIPRERTARNIETQETRKAYWQDLGRRITSLRESARFLFSFQNPFNDRIAVSSDENSITATATREAVEQEYRFSVKQIAQADRFLSPPLDEKTKIEAGNYVFTAGSEEISLNFRGGSLREFADALNRRGRDKIGASLITVQPGTKSLLIESKVTGAGNRLGFSGDAELLAIKLGILEQVNDSRREIVISEGTVRDTSPRDGISPSGSLAINEGVLVSPPLASASIPFALDVDRGSPLMLKLETLTKINPESAFSIPQPPPGPSIPSSGSITYGSITIENNPSTAPLPPWNPPPVPKRTDNLAVLSLSFSDGTKTILRPITDSGDFIPREFSLSEYAAGKTITALNIDNANTHREISIRGAVVYDPKAVGGGLRPLNPVSIAQDAIIEMEGIKMQRPSNTITDIIPGVTLTAKGVSDKPVRLGVNTDREGIKNAIISLVGNYNRLMAEINVLTARSLSSGAYEVKREDGSKVTEYRTRADDAIIDELTYLTKDEADEMRKRLGVFHGDSTLTQLKTSLQRAASAPYPTEEERDLALLAQIGISTFILNSGAGYSYNPASMRGYLQIDEPKLDAAIEQRLPAVKQLFGSDTTGDLIVDTGVAFNMDRISQPFVERGGIISLKTGTIDSQISQDQRRIATMDRQLAAKEAELKIQYSRMESAFSRMEQMTTSLDNFNRQNSNNR